MADLNFEQPERRSFTLPLIIALLVLGAAGFALFRLTPRTTADLSIPRAEVFSDHIVFTDNGSRVVGAEQAEDVLYVLAVVRLTDKLRLPLFLKDITATLIPNDGSLQPATSAVEQRDLANVYTSFPKLRTLAASLGVPPLLRESRVEPGQTVEGYVLIHFPVTPEVWNGRSDAVLSLNLYHQGSITASIPKSAMADLSRVPSHPKK